MVFLSYGVCHVSPPVYPWRRAVISFVSDKLIMTAIHRTLQETFACKKILDRGFIAPFIRFQLILQKD